MTKSTSPAPDRGSQNTATGPKKGTKLSKLAELLNRENGATVSEMAKATKWQSHSVRGAMSGALKKRFGHMISSTNDEKRGRVYRITGQSGQK